MLFPTPTLHAPDQGVLDENRMSRSVRVLELLTDFTVNRGLDERLVSAMHEVAMTGRVRRLRYEHAEGLSVQQAQRDLRDLTAGRDPRVRWSHSSPLLHRWSCFSATSPRRGDHPDESG
jgi:hypothetical protein